LQHGCGIEPLCVAASFDGTGWSCFAVRAMPDRHWAVLRNRTQAAVTDPHSSAPGLVIGLNTYSAARTRAAELACASFAHAVRSDVRRRQIPEPVPLRFAPPAARDTGGDPARLGPIMAAARLGGVEADR
jgi:hypothetical protein